MARHWHERGSRVLCLVAETMASERGSGTRPAYARQISGLAFRRARGMVGTADMVPINAEMVPVPVPVAAGVATIAAARAVVASVMLLVVVVAVVVMGVAVALAKDLAKHRKVQGAALVPAVPGGWADSEARRPSFLFVRTNSKHSWQSV